MNNMISINICSEFAELHVAISHDASNVIDISMDNWQQYAPESELKRHPETGPIFKEPFMEQQAKYRELLERKGVELISPDTQNGAFCQVYTRDPCFVIGNTMFIGSMRDTYRFPEVKGLDSIRQRIENVVELHEQGVVIEGGDVMVLDAGNTVLVGTGQITNELGFRTIRSYLASVGVEKIQRIVHTALHLDCALAPLPNGNALFSMKDLPKDSQNVLTAYFNELIPVDEEESSRFLATNMFWLNPEEVVSNTEVKRTNKYLTTQGYLVHEVDFTQPISIWGSVRCVTCPIVRE